MNTTLEEKIKKVKQNQDTLQERIVMYLRFAYDADLEITLYAPETDTKLVLNRKCDEIDAFDWFKTLLPEYVSTLENKKEFNKKLLEVLEEKE